MRVSISLALFIIHIYQHSSKFLKSKFSQIMAKIINNGEKVGTKIDVGADESI